MNHFSSSAGSPGETLLAEHPLRTDTATVPTRPLEAFVNAIGDWLDKLQPGALVYGNPRIGKTLGAQFVQDHIERLLGSPIPVTLISIPETAVTSCTENRNCSMMLSALGHATPLSGTASFKRQRMIDFMIDRARRAGEHRYLLFVDEAQWLTMSQYRFLMDLHNQLKLSKIRLITVLIGQPELLERRDELRREQQRHLLGRFMTSVHHYEGVADQSDFVRFCRAFDVDTEWPVNSGISYTAYFVPEAFEAGWRLEGSAAEIWEVISRARQAANISTRGELPTQALTALVRWLLQTLHDEDRADLSLERRTIEIAYERVAAHQIISHLTPPAPDA